MDLDPLDHPDFYNSRAAVWKEFHLKEYETLKKEIADLVEHSRKLEIYAVGGIAAFYAWWFLRTDPVTAATGASTALPAALWSACHASAVAAAWYTLMLPSLVVGLGGLRSWAVLKRIDEIAAYLVDVESTFASPGLGWETRRRRIKQVGRTPSRLDGLRAWAKQHLKGAGPFMTTGLLFWALLVIVTLAPLVIFWQRC